MFRAVHKPQDAPITQYFLVCKNGALKLALEQKTSDEVSLLPPGAPSMSGQPRAVLGCRDTAGPQQLPSTEKFKDNFIGKIKAQKA